MKVKKKTTTPPATMHWLRIRRIRKKKSEKQENKIKKRQKEICIGKKPCRKTEISIECLLSNANEEEQNCSKNSLLFYSHLRLVFVDNTCNFIQSETSVLLLNTYHILFMSVDCLALCFVRATARSPEIKNNNVRLFVYTLLLQCKHRSVSYSKRFHKYAQTK